MPHLACKSYTLNTLEILVHSGVEHRRSAGHTFIGRVLKYVAREVKFKEEA